MSSGFLYFRLIIVCFGCHKNAEITESDLSKSTLHTVEKFPVEHDLNGINVGPINLLANPSAIIQSGQYYIIYDQQGSYSYHLLNKRFESILSFAERGDGPGLVKGQRKVFRQNFIENSTLFDYEYDRFINKWDFDFFSGIPKLNNVQTLNIPEDLYNMQSICMINPSKFVGMGGMSEGKLYIFDIKSSESPKITPFIPSLDVTLSDNDKMFKYNGKVVYEPTFQKIVCTSSRFNQIEIYSEEGILLKQIRLGSLNTPFDNPRETRLYYYDIFVDENRIFALYSGNSASEVKREFLNSLKTEIHIFDWEGQPIAKINLDRLVNSFTIDQESQAIICIDDTTEDQRLVKYKLPNGIF